MRLSTVLALSLCSLAAVAQVSVVEPATQARLVDGHTSISLVVRNGGKGSLDARVSLQWLGPYGNERGRVQRELTLPPGVTSVSVPLPLCESCDPLQERLEYQVIPASRNYTAFVPLSGRMSLPYIADYAFTLAVVTAGFPVPNLPFEVRVLAAHPLTRRPVPGVKVTLEEATAVTGEDGVALLRVTRDAEDDGTIDVNGQLGDFRAGGESTSLPNKKVELRAYTDKPIYQPRQTMHVRVLALDSGGRAQEGRELDLRIVDQSDDLSFSAKVTTSRFGIASTDWEIPANAAPGRYTINLKNDETDRYFLRQVSIRSYELPSFRVTAEPDRPFYLSGQPAQVEISGEYLFGKPVSQGKVRIVEADDEAKAIAEGALDSRGHFRAGLDTKAELDGHAKFQDRHYIAFVTDLSTNRTEQRKFDVRISREPVHIYAVRLERKAGGRRLYVTTYTPNGAPLRGDVEVARAGRVLGRGTTNRFGLTRIDLPAEAPDGDDEEWEIRVVGANGERARMEWSPGSLPSYRPEMPDVWLTTDRSLYRAGQSVHCAIGSTAPDRTVLVIASNERDQVVFTRSVRLTNGRAAIQIPYDARFGRSLSVGLATAAARDSVPVRRVYFPGPSNLVLRAKPMKASYRPGDTAILQFEASTQAALGIAIVDQSVLERASTDAAFGRRDWFTRDEDARETNLGGITESDLLNLDPARIDDEDMQLVAEVLAAERGSLFIRADDPVAEMKDTFRRLAAKDIAPVVEAMDRDYQRTLEFPRDDASFERIAGYVLRQVKDPWLQPYYARFSFAGPNAAWTIFSAGPDKKQGTADDCAAQTISRKWFAPTEALMREALRGLRDYPASSGEFVRLLDSAGLRFESLRDPWGSPMRADVTHMMNWRDVRILSAGPDRAFGTPDDCTAAAFRGPYFLDTDLKIDRILRPAPEFPTNPEAFRARLSENGIDFDALRDPWGHAYYVTFRDDQAFSNRVQIYTYAEYDGAAEERRQIVPVKQTTRFVEIRSVGKDGAKSTYDDFVIATFLRVVRSADPPAVAERPAAPAAAPGGTGSIAGVVLDPTGAVVPNTEVKLDDLYVTRSGPDGKFVFRALPPGTYRLSCYATGFRRIELVAIPVTDGNVTRVQLTLDLGTVNEAVEVQAEATMLNTESASVVATKAGLAPHAALSTPRVRDYFPETLYWQPELVTDDAGHASVRVKLADTITTWHVAVIGSTLDGRIAEGSADIRAFQPFLVDLDVPPVLTEGDEITLPVPVRNYLERAQKVAVTAKLPSQLRLLEPVRQPGIVAASSSANAVLAIRADGAVAKAPLRVTAVGGAASDAIEKATSIHPDGERRSAAVSAVVTAGETLPLAVSANAIAGSVQGQVKVYPSLLARILEAIELMLQAPHGCGEQTISSTYPNLLLLKALKEAGLDSEALSPRAMKNLRAGYQRLLRYQTSEGAFTYWGRGDADVPLTAYALEFLADAQPFIEIDEDVVERAQRWLEMQPAEGTAARALRMRALAHTQAEDWDVDRQLGAMARDAAAYGDPYALAAFAMAAMEANKSELAGAAIAQLSRMAQDERGAAWWALRANTPYHGWGRWGQVESTAMAVSALARWRKLGRGDAALTTLIDRGALFLLRSTAAEGGWATSQATARALMALLDVWTRGDDSKTVQIDVRVNGASAGRIALPAGRSLQAPLVVDISRLLRPGANQISLAGFEQGALQIQLTAAWYEPWGPKRPDRDLDMQISYSTRAAAINEAVVCEAVISRPAFRGYGMMIANVGLPPGAEVDRGALEEMIGDSKNGVDSYEVAPDHITFYVWPRAADLKFHFIFRPRFAMKARAAQSVLYDFYNPDSQVVLAPETFVVQP